ncbi:MAG: tannase/feruloyl esterase family alpha/beta hydrolase [Rhizobacter sp.]|nr:tannase/feruloyl esterase family alpha/beta hydrolase [Rhizobacter sp.]
MPTAAMLAKIEATPFQQAQQSMTTSNPRRAPRWVGACFAGAAIAACSTAHAPSPQAAPLAAARPGTLAMPCRELASRLAWPDARLSATAVGAGELTVAGTRVAAHCRVTGMLRERTSGIDGQRYAIGFELRLPERWNGRFYYQANGGVDGSVVPATGLATSGPASASALVAGFAVLSSDAGHSAAQNASFGIDPQARLDYGYAAVAALTPMAKALLAQAYGRPPDRSYIGGCSNGGRHTLVAATRLADQYDGFLVGDPGTVLPRAAIANLVGGRSYAEVAGNAADPGAAFTLAERHLVSEAVLQRCDALDGLVDGMVHDTKACQAAFDLDRDVPTCAGARDGACLTRAQKSTIARLFAGVRTQRDELVYAPFPWDAGLATSDWASWKFGSPSTRDAGAIADIWQVPPADPARFDGRAFMMAADADALLARVQATDAT